MGTLTSKLRKKLVREMGLKVENGAFALPNLKPYQK